MKLGFPLHIFILLCLCAIATGTSGTAINAQEASDDDEFFPPTFDFSDAVQASDAVEGLPWIEEISASFYGTTDRVYWGGYGNRLHPDVDFFCALPASRDSLDVLGGKLASRISRCGDARPVVDELINCTSEQVWGADSDIFNFWVIEEESLADIYGWVIEGEEGDGLFRVIEIRMSGTEEPVYEAYIGDVGPWCTSDPYWDNGTRPNAEDGIDARGRYTNTAGIDLSYALAREMGITGIGKVDWRWKTTDGAYVVSRQPTEWRY